MMAFLRIAMYLNLQRAWGLQQGPNTDLGTGVSKACNPSDAPLFSQDRRGSFVFPHANFKFSSDYTETCGKEVFGRVSDGSGSISSSPSIHVAISVRDRPGYTELMSRLLHNADGFAGADVACVVIDDGSKAFSEMDLRTFFPKCHIFMRDASMTANSATMCQMRWSGMLTKNVPVGDLKTMQFVIIDSDMAVTRSWIQDLQSNVNKTEGVLDLYNSPAHAILRSEGELVVKRDVGFAGLTLRQDLVNAIAHDPSLKGDWEVSAKLQRMNIPLYAFEKSRALHYGAVGSWNICKNWDGDYCTDIRSSELPTISVLQKYNIGSGGADDFSVDDMLAVKRFANGLSPDCKP